MGASADIARAWSATHVGTIIGDDMSRRSRSLPKTPFLDNLAKDGETGVTGRRSIHLFINEI